MVSTTALDSGSSLMFVIAGHGSLLWSLGSGTGQRCAFRTFLRVINGCQLKSCLPSTPKGTGGTAVGTGTARPHCILKAQ